MNKVLRRAGVTAVAAALAVFVFDAQAQAQSGLGLFVDQALDFGLSVGRQRELFFQAVAMHA